MAEVLKQTASAFVLDLLIIGQQKITFRNITPRTLISRVIFNLYDKLLGSGENHQKVSVGNSQF